jgi:UDP-glucuronate 4-epimerase
MTILVTGVAGFIGYHLARRLIERGDDVIGIDNLSAYYDRGLKEARIAELRKLDAEHFAFQRIDFADDEALARALRPLEFDRIVHLGAQAGVRY